MLQANKLTFNIYTSIKIFCCITDLGLYLLNITNHNPDTMPKSDSRNRICIALSKRIAHRQAPPSRGPIYPYYKSILLDVIRNFEPDTRLPPVRELSQHLKVSLATTQRVINELTQEGALYSRPRAGVFIATSDVNTQPQTKPPENSLNTEELSEDNSGFESHFSFGTNSWKPYQLHFWESLITNFQERQPNSQVKLKAYKNPNRSLQELDVYERLNWHIGGIGAQAPTLNLRTHANGKIQAMSTPEGLLPLYYRSNFLFYNKDILNQCGIPEPQYQCFENQLCYLQDANNALKLNGYEPLSDCSQQPITYFGSQNLELYLKLVHANENNEAGKEAYIEAVKRTLNLSKFKHKIPGQNYIRIYETKQQFLAGGQKAFYHGHSVDYWLFNESDYSFPLGAYPMISSDDTLFKWPMVGAINHGSQRPIEAIRFLKFLTSCPAQEAFVGTGTYPASSDCTKLPPTGMCEQLHRKLNQSSRAMHLTTPDQYYLAINVLNNELWHAYLNHASPEAAAIEAIHMGKIFTSRH
jgi:DNA-binding transcriptional regulator YhcF (GntR family)